MWTAVIPASNEEESIPWVMDTLNKAGIEHLILVVNGCMDRTCELAVRSSGKAKLHLLEFPESLGVDIPRAIGAAYAKKIDPTGILFVDGDMKGDISYALYDLVHCIENGLDMALTNCYPYIYQRSDLALDVLKEREILNRKLGLFNILGLASPSHGPHAISRALLAALSPETIAVPPLALAFAAVNNFSIGVGTALSHRLLGSHLRSMQHAALIADTIIGDCRQALLYFNGMALEQTFKARIEPDGYRSARRFDLLQDFLTTLA